MKSTWKYNFYEQYLIYLLPITPNCWGAVYFTSDVLQWPGESWVEDTTEVCRLVDLILGLSDLWLVLKILKLDTRI
jgi:hypothetical protein